MGANRHLLRRKRRIDIMKFQKLLYSWLRRILFRIGEHVTSSHISKLNSAISFLELGRWFKANGYSLHNSSRFAKRDDLYAAIASKIQDEVVLYLEFGVWQGASLRSWSKFLRNPISSLHGFDSFEGLPETWNRYYPKGYFDVKGILPQFEDPRIILHKGWFHETLPGFVLPEHERLLLNLDADIYSSTKCVLDTLQEAICPGTIIIFDEFADHQHELKAFKEFLEMSRMKFRFLGAVFNFTSQCVFERIE
jgi:Macrocin-O-methyltransferase (TylF)